MKNKMQPRTKVIRILAGFSRLTVDVKPTIKESVNEAVFMHDLVFNALELTETKEAALKLIADHLLESDDSNGADDAREIAGYLYTLVTNAIGIVVPNTKKERTLVGKFPTDFTKPILDASNGAQVDLMGGPNAVKF